jgi:hypothetical protein
LRSRHLLLVGCHFTDWLGRLFLRVSNEKRLSSDDRPKREFLVDRAGDDEKNLTLFLERFSRDSRWYSIAPDEFVTELHRRWSERNPPGSATEAPDMSAVSDSATGGSIFISYASEDIDAARQFFDEVQRDIGDVAWLDKSALKPGDDWDRHLKTAVRRCDIFVPLISTNTERRKEGYFRLEWNEAADRVRRIDGRKFIFPTVIDAEFDRGAGGYALVPDAFTTRQYAHAPGGHVSEALRKELVNELRELRAAIGRRG